VLGHGEPGAPARYLQLLGEDGVLPDGIDPQPLVRILVRQLPSLDVPQHPPVHVVAPRLPWARRGQNLVTKMHFLIPSCYTRVPQVRAIPLNASFVRLFQIPARETRVAQLSPQKPARNLRRERPAVTPAPQTSSGPPSPHPRRALLAPRCHGPEGEPGMGGSRADLPSGPQSPAQRGGRHLAGARRRWGRACA